VAIPSRSRGSGRGLLALAPPVRDRRSRWIELVEHHHHHLVGNQLVVEHQLVGWGDGLRGGRVDGGQLQRAVRSDP
jgi:hypothetical protein